MSKQTKIEWVNYSQTLLRINNRIISLASVTQIILNEEMEEGESSQVTFYFGVPIGNCLTKDNVPTSPEPKPSEWWLTYGGEEAEALRKFFGFSS